MLPLQNIQYLCYLTKSSYLPSVTLKLEHTKNGLNFQFLGSISIFDLHQFPSIRMSTTFNILIQSISIQSWWYWEKFLSPNSLSAKASIFTQIPEKNMKIYLFSLRKIWSTVRLLVNEYYDHKPYGLKRQKCRFTKFNLI